MIILGIILGCLSIICIILACTSTWIDTHDKSNAAPWQLNTVIIIHMTLAFPIWVSQIVWRKIQKRKETRKKWTKACR